MFRKLIKKHIRITKKPLDIFYKNKPVKNLKRKYKLLNIIYREKRLITFLFGNHLAFLFEILLTWILTESLHLWYMLSYGFSLISGWAFVYFFHHYITFELTHDSYSKFPLFMLITIANNVSSWFFVYLITHFFTSHYIITIILVSLPMSLVYYKLTKKFIFRLPI